MTLCFGLFLAIYTPYQMWAETVQQMDGDGLTLVSLGCYFLGALSGIVGVRWCILLTLSYTQMCQQEHEFAPSRESLLPYVSILVPAYCDASCIEDAMRSLICLDYPAYEIIVVDDGSEDATYRLALPFAGTHHSKRGVCHVQVFTKANQGNGAPIILRSGMPAQRSFFVSMPTSALKVARCA